MNFVLDTKAVSETEKPRPNPGYVAWRDSQDRAHLFITTNTLAEVWQGFHSLEPNHPDYVRIKAIATDLPRTYRVLNFDTRAAAIWGKLTAKVNPLPLRDSFIEPSPAHGAVGSLRATLAHFIAWAKPLAVRARVAPSQILSKSQIVFEL